MLLQSYSGTIRVFPAVPAGWKDVSFTTLRAEGAFLVSADRRARLTQRVEIFSEKGGTCRLENPFGDSPLKIEPPAKLRKIGDEIRIRMSPGQKVVLLRSNVIKKNRQ